MNSQTLKKLRKGVLGILPAVILLMVLTVILGTFLDYGITWDESLHKDYGNLLLAHFKSGFQNNLYLSFQNLYKYGGAFDLPAQFIVNLAIASGIERLFEIRHLINAIAGLLSFFFVYRTAGLLSGRTAGIIALLFIILIPRYYGHIFNNPKDIPFALGYIMSLFYFLKLSGEMPRPSMLTVLKTGLAVGFALAIRIGGVFLFAILFLMPAVFLLQQIRARGIKSLREILLESRPGILQTLFTVPLIAWLFMLLLWPYAARSPLGKPLEVMLGMSHFPWTGRVFFGGEHLLAQNLPWDYLPIYALITLPEFQLLVLLFWPLPLVRKIASGEGLFLNREFPFYFALLISFLLPPLVAIVLNSTLYDGLRHFLFILPPLAVLNGCAFAWLITRGSRKTAVPVTIVVILLAGITLVDMFELHPYQSVYYNRLFGGGLKEAARRYETDYWGGSYREGALWLKNRLHEAKGAKRNKVGSNDGGRMTKIAVCVPPVLADYYFNREKYIRQDLEFRSMLDEGVRPTPELLQKLRDKSRRMTEGVYASQEVRIVKPDQHPDFFIAFKRWNCDRSLEGGIIHNVERQNTPLLIIKRVGQNSP